MTRKRVVYIVLLLLLILIITPVAQAQDPELPTFEEILSRLGPRSGINLLWDILLYAIFFLSMITSALIPDKQLLSTLTIVTVMIMAVVAKVNIFAPDDFGTLVLNSGMFVLPMIVAGMVRSKHGPPKAMAPAAFTGILGGVYFFLFWAVVQRTYGGG